MKKTGKEFLLLSLLCCIASGSFAQWESRPSGLVLQRGIKQIVSPSDSVVWAVAYDASVIFNPCRDFSKSTDGGITWTAGRVNDAPIATSWSSLAALDKNTAWALMINNPPPAGSVWKTSDGGNTWMQEGAGVIYSADASFPDIIHFWDANNGVVAGDPVNGEFEIYTTSDGGTTWFPVDTASIPDPLPGEYGSPACFAVYKDVIWFGTNKGRIYKSKDHGFTWKVYDTGFPVNLVYNIAFANEDTGWIGLADTANYFVGLYRTTDGGGTWTNITPAENFYVPYMCYVPNTNNVLVSSGYHPDNFSVFGSSYSFDGGDTWVDIDDSVKHLAVDFFNSETGWSGDVNLDQVTGGMWTYTGGALSGVADLPAGSTFKLYPNPGDGLFYFSFNTGNNKPIDLRVINSIGKIIWEEVYKDHSQTWLRSIDLRHFNKGIYFLTIENNGSRYSQKLVIQ